MEHQQGHHSRKSVRNLDFLILRNLSKCLREVPLSHFALTYKGALYVRLCQMPLKYLKTHLLHNLGLKIDKFHGLLTKVD